jgi:2-polyprenyl-6-methoxyphenol hydroxylase-like FAD-dependent oxidoreductase
MGGRQSRDRPGVETDEAATRGTSTSSSPPPKSPSAPATSAVLAPSTRASSSSGRKPSNRLGPEDTVVIAGGGISGLALAAALQAAPEASRPKVIVMERDASAEARRQGYGVTLSETNAALAGLGILEDLRASNTRSCAHWTFKDDGSVLGYFGLAFLPEERKKPKRDRLTNLRVPRNRVREILLKRLLPGTVRFGCRVVDYEEVSNDTGSSVVVVIEKRVPSSDDETSHDKKKVGGGAGRPEWAENEVKKTGGEGSSEGSSFVETETLRGVSMLVASDGVRSAVQRRRMPGASLNYLGVVLITGFTQLRHPLLEKQGFYTLDGKRARVFTMPFSSDEDVMKHEVNDETVIRKSMWQISVRVTEAEARVLASAPRALASDFEKSADAFSSVRAFVRSVAGTWHDPLPAMFNTTDWESVWCGPLYDRDEPPRPKTKTNAISRVTAVGDAAHPMSPFKGMGANTALFDAWHLKRWLLKAPVPRAIACFEREMFARAWGKGARQPRGVRHVPLETSGGRDEKRIRRRRATARAFVFKRAAR